jgi:spoIIIJ-associated protein
VKEVTAAGQSVEKAVVSALSQLNVSRDEVEVEVVNEGKRGIFGIFGTKPAIVKVILKPDPIEETKHYLLKILGKMDIIPDVQVKKDGRNIEFNMTGEKMALVIGKRGQTLNSLQYLTQLAFNRKTNQFMTIILNAENYRSRREQALVQLAGRLAERAIQNRQSVTLEPMPSFERKIIHHALSKNKKIKTHSEGEEPHRYLVIDPLK